MDSDMEIAARDAAEKISDPVTQEEIVKKYGQKVINNEDKILERLKEVQLNFYNRLESKKLIKKQGRVPFTEHMTCSNPEPIKIVDSLQVHDDIKREVAL